MNEYEISIDSTSDGTWLAYLFTIDSEDIISSGQGETFTEAMNDLLTNLPEDIT